METSRDDFVIAIRSAFLKRGNQQRFSLLSLILFSIIFLVLGNYNFKIINFNKILIKEIVYYSSFIITVPENIIKKSVNRVSGHLDYYKDYQIVKSELQELKNKDLSKKIIAYENIELRKLIDDYFIEDSQEYARVLIDKKSPFLRSIVINKGSKDGVKPGMTVYDDIYLIGKVVEVNFLTSRVLLISDINSKVPVTIQPLNVQGIMSGFDKQKGLLQYIKDEKLINSNNEELIVVTSGTGGIFRSGIPIGKINFTETTANNKIVVNFYRNFSQLKYVKILSHKKENIKIDQSTNKIFDIGQKSELNNQAVNIKTLQQQKIITDEVRVKFEIENTKLKKDIINAQKIIEKQDKEIQEIKTKERDLEFLELNLLHGHKCRKTLFKQSLYEIKTDEYRACVLNKGPNRN